MLSETQTIDNVEYRVDHYFDTTECYQTVKLSCQDYWESRVKNQAYDNYRFDDQAPEWSLGPMLLTGQFDLGFSIMYVDNHLFSVGGIRTHDADTVLIMCRHYSLFTIKPVNHAVMFPFQMSIAKKQNYKKAWVTVNSYNQWQRIWYSKRAESRRLTDTNLYKKAEIITSTCVALGMGSVNNTEQFILTWDL